jgi:hypothetical protein
MSLALEVGCWPWDVLLALGWLSREGKVRLWRDKAALMAELKKH